MDKRKYRMKKISNKLPEFDKNSNVNEEVLEEDFKYRELIEAMPLAVMLHTKGEIIFLNPAALRLLGAENKNIIGCSIYKYLSDNRETQEFNKIIDLLHTDIRSVTKENGDIIEVEIISMEINYQNKIAILTVLNDITERRRMENMLEENFGRQSIINEIYGLTLNELDPNILISRVVITITEYMNIDEFAFLLFENEFEEGSFYGTAGINESFINILKKAFLDTHQEFYKKLNIDAKILRMDESSKHPLYREIELEGFTGISCYPLKTTGKLIGISIIANKNNKAISEKDEELLIAICNQLSAILQNARLIGSLQEELIEKKNSEKELKKLSLAVEQSPSSVVITDPNGIIIYINPAFTQVAGYTLEEAVGKTPKILNSGLLPKSFYKDMWKTIRSGNIWHGEFHNKKKNGEYYWESASISPVFGEAGDIVNYVSVKEDVTGLKLAAQELKKAKEEAERANAAKSNFLANMSHEIRTPMNAILGFSQLLMKDKSLKPKQRDYLESINRSGEHLLGLINDILEMSKIDAGHVELIMSSFDLNNLVRDVERILSVRADEKNLKLLIKTNSEFLGYVTCDENKVRQIFINLIGNAIKFTENGEIHWRLSSKPIGDQKIKLISEIEDTGPGISEEDMKKLFKAFEQTQTGINAGGTGLGLTISQRFAKMMDGEISVQSKVGKGSIFHVELEMLKQTALTPNKDIKTNIVGIDKNYNNKPYKLLVVDDITENRLWLIELLTNVGFLVKEACDGNEAIDIFNSWKPDLIFMDLHMPIMDGYEAARIIKMTEYGAGIPILAITASIFEENNEKMKNSLMEKCIYKPFKEKEIFDNISEYLDVRFIKERDNFVITSKLEEENIEGISTDVINHMKEATINGDLDYLIELIEKASDTIPIMAARLKELAENYRFEELLKILE